MAGEAGSRRFVVAPPAPFRLDLTTWALRRRAHNEIDRWDGRAYRRVLPIDDGAIAVTVHAEGTRDAPRLAIALAGAAVGPGSEERVQSALSKLLGLDVDMSGFAAMAESDPALGELAERFRGLRPPRFPTVFEALVNGIACQQLSLDVGVHLLNRLTAALGRPVGGSDGPRAFPGPLELAAVDPATLRGLGFSRAKAETVVSTARAIVDDDLDLEGLTELDGREVSDRLTDLKGVGRWTAEYVMLRGLGRLQVFPGDDVGARNKLGRFLGLEGQLNYEEVRARTSAWRPYAGVVYFYLLLDSLMGRST